MARHPHLLQERLARFLAPIPAKELARRIDCDPRTAENMKRGHWPIARHWLGLLATFGEDITEAVFHPEKAAERLEKEVRDLEAVLETRRAALRDAERFASRMAEIRDRDPRRSRPLGPDS